MEQGVAYWRRYLLAFALMGIAAGATAGSAYLLGEVINQAYVDKNVRGIAILSGVTVLLLFTQGVRDLRPDRDPVARSATPSSPTTSGGCSPS